MPILNRRLKAALRPFLPARLRHAVLNRQAAHQRYTAGSPADIFGAIYRDGIWGSGDDFMSGVGSRDVTIVGPYVEAVRKFATTLSAPVTAVDLGCGDFAVGKQIVELFNNYHACDVVPSLIERNRKKFSDRRVTFEVVDLVDDPLPLGDVAMVRQVLQHLSNEQIVRVLKKLAAYRYVIVTEHLPAGDFTANMDKVTGPHTRLSTGSGLALDMPPFNFARTKMVLCRVPDRGTIIETALWV